jgi:hypothetical protein
MYMKDGRFLVEKFLMGSVGSLEFGMCKFMKQRS